MEFKPPLHGVRLRATDHLPEQVQPLAGADAVAAHMDLLGFGEELAVGDVADDVVAWKPLGFVLL